MTPQEAIEILEVNAICSPQATKFKKAVEVAKQALEKQIPKKPDVVGEEYIYEKDEWEKDYECSNCGNPYVDDSFCSCCGQKIDWSDTE